MRVSLLIFVTLVLCHAQVGDTEPRLKIRVAPADPPQMVGPDGSLDSRFAGTGARISEVAERFSQTAQQYMCLETLQQRVIRPNSVRKVKGNTVTLASNPQYNRRQILSYYSFTTVGGSPAIREIRQMLTVDKETIAKDFEGHRYLRNALLSHDDEVKNRLFDQFNEEGMSGVATDLGQMMLLFDPNSIKNFAFEYDREETVGGTPTMVIRYMQRRGPEAVKISERGKQTKDALRGWLWVRLPDYLPVRITMISARREKKREIRDEAEVDYIENPNGALLPTAVIHRRYEDDILAAEDDFRYSNWQSLK